MIAKKWSLVAACCAALLSGAAQAGPVSLTAGQDAALRKLVAENHEAADRYGDLVKWANAALKDSPDPIETVSVEGTLASSPENIQSKRAMLDMGKISCLAWVWLVGGYKKYAQKGIEYIVAWAKINKSDGDPINETGFEQLIVGYDILRPQFSPEDRQIVDAWLHEKAIKLWNDPRNHTENWQSHRLKIVGMIATVLNDDGLWRTVTDGYTKQIKTSFLPDGETTDFNLRDALHYHLYSVKPMLTLACIAHQRSKTPDWYTSQSSSGSSLKLSVDFIVPFALGQKKHIEFAHSKIAFDRERAKAGEGEYAPHPWSPCDASPVFSEASCLDPDTEHLAVKVSCGAPHQRFVDWESVINSIKADS